MKQIYHTGIIICVCILFVLSLPLRAQLGILPLKDQSQLTGLSVDLLQLEQDYITYILFGGNPQNYIPPHPLSDYENGQIRLEIITTGNGAAVLPLVQLLGLQEGVAFKRLINGTFPILTLPALIAVPDILSIHLAYMPSFNSGAVTSQGDVALNTDALRDVYNLSGEGIKVGVLSDSYNALQDETTGITSGDLPGPGNPNGYLTPVELMAESSGKDEGRAMLEIIHDLAPEASLAFHTAKGGKAAFSRGILALAEQAGCDVIVDDIVYSSSAYFQDGVIAQAVDSVTKAGVAYFTSAGNQGNFSYEAAFAPGDSFLLDFIDRVGNNIAYPVIRHDFGSEDYLQNVTISPGSTVKIVLQWDDPHTGVSGIPGPLTDLDLFLTSADGSEIIASSINTNYWGNPVELISYTNNTGSIQNLNLVIGLTSGPFPDLIKYIYYGAMQIQDAFVGGSTIFGQANADGAIAVGTVSYDDTPNYGNPSVIPRNYSSQGGTPILFDDNGLPLDAQVRFKPNIIAVDGVDNTFFGADSDNNGFPNFFGTSAAAPHAAAVAALLRQLDPELSPARLRSIMEGTALDAGNEEFSFLSGWGLLEGMRAAAVVGQCAARMFISGDDTLFPDSRIQGGAVVETDLTVHQQLHITAGETIRLLPGFQVRPSVRFSARIESSSDCNEVQQPASSTISAGNQQKIASLNEPVTLSSISEKGWKVFPNPFTDQLSMQYDIDQAGEISIQVFDSRGYIVSQPLLNTWREVGSYQEVLPLEMLPPGLYVLSLRLNGTNYLQKLIKQ